MQEQSVQAKSKQKLAQIERTPTIDKISVNHSASPQNNRFASLQNNNKTVWIKKPNNNRDIGSNNNSFRVGLEKQPMEVENLACKKTMEDNGSGAYKNENSNQYYDFAGNKQPHMHTHVSPNANISYEPCLDNDIGESNTAKTQERAHTWLMTISNNAKQGDNKTNLSLIHNINSL